MTSRLSYDLPPNQGNRSSSYNQYSSTSYGNNPAARNSQYYEPGEELDDGFDVRADFDGDGPRWSERKGARKEGSVRSGGALGMGMMEEANYRPVSTHNAPSGYTDPTKSVSREEMVSVPMLGPEWQKSELHELSRRGQAELKGDKRSRAWKEWTRDQRGLCGIKWLTRKVLVFIIFAFLAALGVTLYFVIPRVPNFEFYTDSPFSVDNSTVNFNRVPTNFSFSGNLNLYGDGSGSYLPIHFTSLQATLYDETTNKAIAKGDWGNHYMEHKDQQPVVLPVNFAYSALNTSDTTWNNMYSACGHKWTGVVRPDLKFRLVLKISIVGLTNKPEISTQISDIECPFELGVNSV
ncbi:uncharacterized protein I303_105814 [Kwoniella dejecticola CBS 10117]|uniref:Late embryogenesis abundant protein LEA-2 subgroup domain-containing protein n=1 Tax=Kwoniella dejecticola CBS 10117 TaxID=1296121 RepID=A0A1A6A0I2_9TREE|nr:uncharacterized protein I303_05836 [Kwoniella dejecticola CBS 10117]OBR83556.1 hypothetical protein I303_05836 [Kwoniella dejecticola CBS 10117]